MNDASAQFFAIALTAMWCGFGLYGILRKIERSPQARDLLDRFRRSRLSTKAAIVAGFATVVAIGGTKPGGGDPPRGLPPPAAGVVEPAVAPVEVRTNNVVLRSGSSSAVEVEDWRRHGSSSGGVWLDFDEPFFKIGTNPVSRAYVAANGTMSFDTMRRPPVGAPLPDGTGLPALAPLLAPLGMVPEANWGGASRPGEPLCSRFWHDAVPGRGRVFTWENALLDRLPGRRVSVQAELMPSGDFTCRYDFTDVLDPPATNVVIGAQVGTNGVNALALLGTNVLSSPVWRVDGACVTNGVSIADMLCTNGVFRTPSSFAIEWKNTTGVATNADTDCDGLSDWDEVFLHGTSPVRPDTDSDGLSDGSEIDLGYSPTGYDMDDDGLVDGIDPNPLVRTGDGFGTSPLWVQCSFGNAAEINAEGYDNYVARITGESVVVRASGDRSRSGAQSGYRKLFELDVAVSDFSGNRRVLVGVGDKTIVLRSGGTFRFSLEKGRKYALVTDAPDIVSFSCNHPAPVVIAPTRTEDGVVFWRASGIEVTPSTRHFHSTGEECEFSALCLDCHPSNATDWSWTCNDPRLSLSSSGSTNCTVSWLGPGVSWGSASFTVSFSNLGRTVSETVVVTFGDHSEPQTNVGIGFPAAFFAESGNPVPLVVSIAQDAPVEGTLTLSAVDGGALLGVSSDEPGEACVSLPLEVSVPAEPFFSITNYVVAGAPSSSVGATRFNAAFDSGGGSPETGASVPTTAIRVDGVSVPSAPSTGLAVLAGTDVGLRVDLTPAGAGLFVETDWLVARRKSDGSYHDWVSVASGVPGGLHWHGFQQPGIFRIQADVVCANGTNTVHYLRNGIGPYDPSDIEPQNHIGVASTQDQLDLRNFAVTELGQTSFALSATLPSLNGFSSVGSGKWKCNAFVAYCAMSVGQTVPVTGGHPPISSYPPVANNWAMGSTIPGWTFLGTGIDPEPGWICGHPQPGGLGHVGIVDYDGHCIAAGTYNVNRRYKRFLDGSCGYNRFGD